MVVGDGGWGLIFEFFCTIFELFHYFCEGFWLQYFSCRVLAYIGLWFLRLLVGAR